MAINKNKRRKHNLPVFEYKCNNCNSKFEVFHKSLTNPENVSCPQCHSKENQKVFSTFSSVGFSTSSSGCETGNCSAEPSYSGGCSSGFCGLN
ncbi:MAG: hypothetical protein B6D44_05740 [Ignavibacteriales bacterium UTCHB2]|nr:MAG: hypothetical protein B6D44_05740 [Ignavibacteriales bacterium UTCHB2]